MSASATFWAWSQQVTSTQKLTLLALANCHNESTGQCNPSIAYLSKSTGLNRKTVMKSLGELESLGLIIAQKGNGFGSHYTIKSSTKSNTSTEIGTGTEIGKGGAEIGTGTSPKNGTAPVPKLGHESIKNLKDESKRETKKGSRLSPDWTITNDWIAEAKKIRSDWHDQHVIRIADQFKDYWIAQPGQKGVKTDWMATWRNWCRRDNTQMYPAPANKPSQPRKLMPLMGRPNNG